MDLVVEDESRVGACYFIASEDNVRAQVAIEWMSFGSDEAAPAPEGVFLRSNPHPARTAHSRACLGTTCATKASCRSKGHPPADELFPRRTSVRSARPYRARPFRRHRHVRPGNHRGPCHVCGTRIASDGVIDVFVNGEQVRGAASTPASPRSGVIAPRLAFRHPIRHRGAVLIGNGCCTRGCPRDRAAESRWGASRTIRSACSGGRADPAAVDDEQRAVTSLSTPRSVRAFERSKASASSRECVVEDVAAFGGAGSEPARLGQIERTRERDDRPKDLLLRGGPRP